VISHLTPLKKEELVKILTEPRNALIKQYQKLMEMEGVKLRFNRDALEALAEQAEKKGTGARGLRSLLEELMLEVMYSVPSVDNVAECTINAAAVNGEAEPQLKKKTARKRRAKAE